MKEWTALERALRELHRVLLRRASREYTQQHALAEEPGPGELLMLATRDENFAWLRSLSELMADIDHLREQPEARDHVLLCLLALTETRRGCRPSSARRAHRSDSPASVRRALGPCRAGA